MNGVNEKTAESHEANRQFRIQKWREEDEQDLPVRQKTNASEDFCREARKGREQSRRAEDKSQEAQKRLKAQRQRDASRRQSNKGSQAKHR